MRMHYLCARHAKKVPHEDVREAKVPLVRPRSGEDGISKKCCFCTRWAVKRGRTNVQSSCPAGHIPPERLKEIAERAMTAAVEAFVEESPLLGMGIMNRE